ncbi:hypothetical protein E3Q22_04449, partial [Wallemia mellicola]
KPVGQTSPNANTYDIPAPIPVKTIYDRFDKQEEFPNEYLGFNHSSTRKAPPTRAKGTLIQPGQARHAARVSKQQEDDRLSKAEDAKTDIHYDRLQEQWSQFNDDKKRIYPDPAFYLPPPGTGQYSSVTSIVADSDCWPPPKPPPVVVEVNLLPILLAVPVSPSQYVPFRPSLSDSVHKLFNHKLAAVYEPAKPNFMIATPFRLLGNSLTADHQPSEDT